MARKTPLHMVRNIGIISFLVSMVMAVYYLVRYFLCGISVEGWTSLMLVMLAFFGLVYGIRKWGDPTGE